ncbi:MAG: hypothetical protein J7L96_07580 [Bacteroidales bacterium]|nr:hypothetical protein [Bacteroidales bacterium]
MKNSHKNTIPQYLPDILLRHCPSGSSELLRKWLQGKQFSLRISRSRVSKLGDFRPAHNYRIAQISINEDLHPVEFLVTLAHEIAHYDISKAQGTRFKAQGLRLKAQGTRHKGQGLRNLPHGVEWREAFRAYVREIIEYRGDRDRELGDGTHDGEHHEFLSKEIKDALRKCYLERERIASTPCMELKRIIEKDSFNKVLRVQDLDEGMVFSIRNGKSFIKGPRLRTRYRCMELGTRKTYTLHPLAEVIRIAR